MSSPEGDSSRRDGNQTRGRADQPLAVGFALVRLQESTNPCASAFDVLQTDGDELLNAPFERRREVLEALFADHRVGPPWTLCPSTTGTGRWRGSGCMSGPTCQVSKASLPRASWTDTGRACGAGPSSAAGSPSRH
ncbi:hypothetical protein ACFWVP_19810 [Streptomyces sp. NPDC058637]|uniref:ATP-dependent DNA ligase n=1 Tax=Streptomyces sp. NPDC058637 TaxID=3346569 RepID=UPI00365153FC